MGFTREAESPCPRVEGPTPQLATKRSLVPGVLFFVCWYQALVEHSTAAIGFHFGGRPHKRNYCFVLTSVGFTREAESPCPRVEGPTPQLATKRSLVPGVLFFFRWYQALAGTPH